MENEKQKPDYSINWLVFYILIILTIGEYIMGVIATTNITAVMFAIALGKAYFIVVKYMNVGRLFKGDQEGH
jgi:hypothetical protein